ncbi:MAG: S41 family peptidase [Sphingomicrobium sp.]
MAQQMVRAPRQLAPSTNASATSQAERITPTDVDHILSRLQLALSDYPYPATATEIERVLRARRNAYRAVSSKALLAQELTADMRAIGKDQHLTVTLGEELGVRKNPTAAEQQHARDFDRANAFGVRGARRLPGNIGYVDLAYLSPDPDAGRAIAAAMQLVSGTDALIIDLRHNGGGSGETERTLASYFFTDEVQLSGIVENIGRKRQERQHWTAPYVEGPRYLSKPVYILVGPHTHSAAEVFAYDLHNLKVAKIIGQHTSGDATSSTGEIDLGDGFAALVPNGELISPITHGNYFRVGVIPDVFVEPENALPAAYGMALNESRPRVHSDELLSEKSKALSNPTAALTAE